MHLASGATTDWTALLVLAAIILTVATFATWGADRYEIDWVGHLLTGRMPWTRAVGGLLVVLLVTAAVFSALDRAHASAVGSLAADRLDTTDAAAPAAVSGLASVVPPTADAPSFASLPLASATTPIVASTLAGGEGRQEPRYGHSDALEGPAVPAGPFGLALEVEPAGAVPGSPGPDTAPELPPVADAIAACESGAIDADGRPVLGTYSLTAANSTSSARGKYQAVTATWEWVTGLPAPASAYPEHVQDQFFVDLWDDGNGASHWDASAWCWAGTA